MSRKHLSWTWLLFLTIGLCWVSCKKLTDQDYVIANEYVSNPVPLKVQKVYGNLIPDGRFYHLNKVLHYKDRAIFAFASDFDSTFYESRVVGLDRSALKPLLGFAYLHKTKGAFTIHESQGILFVNTPEQFAAWNLDKLNLMYGLGSPLSRKISPGDNSKFTLYATNANAEVYFFQEVNPLNAATLSETSMINRSIPMKDYVGHQILKDGSLAYIFAEDRAGNGPGITWFLNEHKSEERLVKLPMKSAGSYPLLGALANNRLWVINYNELVAIDLLQPANIKTTVLPATLTNKASDKHALIRVSGNTLLLQMDNGLLIVDAATDKWQLVPSLEFPLQSYEFDAFNRAYHYDKNSQVTTCIELSSGKKLWSKNLVYAAGLVPVNTVNPWIAVVDKTLYTINGRSLVAFDIAP